MREKEARGFLFIIIYVYSIHPMGHETDQLSINQLESCSNLRVFGQANISSSFIVSINNKERSVAGRTYVLNWLKLYQYRKSNSKLTIDLICNRVFRYNSIVFTLQ